MKRVLIWDWPVRIGHWLMAGGFVVAWITSDSETFRLVHVLSGSIVLAVAVFRLAWGVFGSRYALFSSFVRGPQKVGNYLTSLLGRQPEHHAGHNPVGGWAILLLLAFGIASGVSGWAAYNNLGGDWLKSLHDSLSSAMLGVVIIHLIGVISGSWALWFSLFAPDQESPEFSFWKPTIMYWSLAIIVFISPFLG